MQDKPPHGKNDRTPRKPVRRQEYDGVIYEPSGARIPPATRPPASQNRGNPKRSAPARGARPVKRTKKSFAVFYILTLLAGVIVCVVLFAMAFNTMTKNNPVVEGTPITSPTPPPGIEGKDIQTLTGMVTKLNAHADPRTMTLLDIETNRESEYALPDSTEMKNRFGSPMAFSDIAVGKIVDAGYDTKTLSLTWLTESAQAWEHRFKSNVKINTEDSTLTLGNDQYVFNSQTLVLYDNAPYPIGHIQPIDTVSLIGFSDKVWCIRVESNHGFLRLEDTDKVTGGTLAVDTSLFMGFEEVSGPIALAEGTHRVIVEGTNIEPYITEVVIKSGETASVSLIDAQLKMATLRVNASETDAEVIIDGVAVSNPLAAELSYGEHSVRVEKDGFIPVEQAVSLTKPLTEISITLTQIVKNGQLSIYTSPSQAEIFVDGSFIGYSTITHEVETGQHTITARKEGYNDCTITVQADEGENISYLLLTEKPIEP